MINSHVYELCKKLFPQLVSKAKSWYPIGKNAVRFTVEGVDQFIFRCDDDGSNYKLETVDSFIERMIGV